MNVPLDLLRRASKIERYQCSGEAIEVSVTLLYTARLSKPDVGFSESPFVSEINYTDRRPTARQSGRSYLLTHRDYFVTESDRSTPNDMEPGRITFERRESRDLPFERLELNLEEESVTWSPRTSSGQLESDDPVSAEVRCELTPLFASPQDYLQSILKSAGADEGVGSSSPP